MNTDKEQIKLWVQEALDELFIEHLLPFKLTAYEVNGEGRDYVVPFYDSRLHSIRFCWTDNRSFKQVVRAAVLARVEISDYAKTQRSHLRLLARAS
jgi:hypothetical protein